MPVKTSIIILTYNELELTKKCLASIDQYTDKEEIELIIVDNGSLKFIGIVCVRGFESPQLH